MTMVVALLSPEYAVVIGDTRSTFSSPLTFTQPDGSALEIPASPENPGIIDGIAKARITEDGCDLLASAGERQIQEAQLHFVGPERGFEADDLIVRTFERRMELASYPSIPKGTYSLTEALHVFSAGGRFVATRVAALPWRVDRYSQRSVNSEVIWLGIGNGATTAEFILKAPLVAAEWDELKGDVGIEGSVKVAGFWIRMVRSLSKIIPTQVNDTVTVWRRLSTDSRWEATQISGEDSVVQASFGSK